MRLVLAIVLLCSASSGQAAISVLGPVPYRQSSDSPFLQGLQQGSIFLEDFEDGLLNTPGAAVREGRPREDQGVDEDDGSLDGLGRNIVWVGPGGRLPDIPGNWNLEISFTPNAILGFPHYVGVALNGFTMGPPGAYRLNAFDGTGNSLGETGISIAMSHLPLGTPYYSSEGVQFIGFHSEIGISRMLLSAYSFDHLQYGWVIPEPGAVTLSGLTAALFLSRRRRRMPAL